MSNQRMTSETAPPAPPNAMVIFGAGGDLTKRKLIPALFHLCHGGLLPVSFAVVGLDWLDMDDAAYRARQRDGAEHHGLPLLQWLYRAVVEPPAHRSRPDHGRRIRRCRAPRCLPRGSRRTARYDPESSAGPARLPGHGATQFIRIPGRTQRDQQLDNWRWAGVPIYLRTGKRLPAQYTEIAIQFKKAPTTIFKDTATKDVHPDMLLLRIQPNEGIQMSFGAKIPGPSMQVGTVNMDFCYAVYFGHAPATGYETLIYDCLHGDATLFKHADTVEKGWEIVESVMDVWAALPPREFPNYAAGTWGPPQSGSLLKNDGRKWRRIEIPGMEGGD